MLWGWKEIWKVNARSARTSRKCEDVRTVLLKNPDIDVEYIRKWLKEFDLFSEKKEFLKTFEEVKKI